MDPVQFNSRLSSVGVRGPGRRESQFLPTRTYQPVAVMVAQAHDPFTTRGTQWQSQDGEQRERRGQLPPSGVLTWEDQGGEVGGSPAGRQIGSKDRDLRF